MKPTYGVSFSIKQCRNFTINHETCLLWLLEDMKFRRFRLMSYWNEIEPTPGNYNFAWLDKQITIIEKKQATMSLCLGARQPRWPENHWPDWAWELNTNERTAKLLDFITIVVERYKHSTGIVSYQLENEALLQSFGKRPEVIRSRILKEFLLVKKLDSKQPIIMSTSDSWGTPLRKPIPDIVGFSLYTRVYNDRKKSYTKQRNSALQFRLRSNIIKSLWGRDSFIHELQLEPWGPQSIWNMTRAEQDKTMSMKGIIDNVAMARATKLTPIDLWGGEWWYWRYSNNDNSIAEAVKEAIAPSK